MMFTLIAIENKIIKVFYFIKLNIDNVDKQLLVPDLIYTLISLISSSTNIRFLLTFRMVSYNNRKK